jgi:polyribonucleotide nucleotidyltransferase
MIQAGNDTLYLLKIIRYMVNEAHGWSYSIEEYDSMKDQLHKLTNADFATMNITDVIADIGDKFNALQLRTSAEQSLSDEGAFIKAIDDVQQMLNKYQQLNNIGSIFFRYVYSVKNQRLDHRVHISILISDVNK